MWYKILYSIIAYFFVSILFSIIFPNYFGNEKFSITKMENLIYIKDTISKESITKIIKSINKHLIIDKNKNINFYISSYGGDYEAGVELINYMKEKKKDNIKFICFAHIAGSTAFTIFQYCNKRYVMDYSKLYQHELQISTSGTIDMIEEWYSNKFVNHKNVYKMIKTEICEKIKMDILEYEKKIKNEWYINTGLSIVYNGLADKIVVLVS
jgi:ATP-dependent protease ClpP protease subunit